MLLPSIQSNKILEGPEFWWPCKLQDSFTDEARCGHCCSRLSPVPVCSTAAHNPCWEQGRGSVPAAPRGTLHPGALGQQWPWHRVEVSERVSARQPVQLSQLGCGCQDLWADAPTHWVDCAACRCPKKPVGDWLGCLHGVQWGGVDVTLNKQASGK